MALDDGWSVTSCRPNAPRSRHGAHRDLRACSASDAMPVVDAQRIAARAGEGAHFRLLFRFDVGEPVADANKARDGAPRAVPNVGQRAGDRVANGRGVVDRPCVPSGRRSRTRFGRAHNEVVVSGVMTRYDGAGGHLPHGRLSASVPTGSAVKTSSRARPSTAMLLTSGSARRPASAGRTMPGPPSAIRPHGDRFSVSLRAGSSSHARLTFRPFRPA